MHPRQRLPSPCAHLHPETNVLSTIGRNSRALAITVASHHPRAVRLLLDYSFTLIVKLDVSPPARILPFTSSKSSLLSLPSVSLPSLKPHGHNTHTDSHHPTPRWGHCFRLRLLKCSQRPRRGLHLRLPMYSHHPTPQWRSNRAIGIGENG
jgi:hypothetical protein